LQNEFKEIPACLFRMRSLMHMNFQYNQIDRISPSLCQLNNLRQLHLTGNNLKEIPSSMGVLTNLQVLRLDQNPIVEVDPELIHGKTEYLLKHLYERLTENQAVNRMNIIFIGPEKSGKSSIVDILKTRWGGESIGESAYSVSSIKGMNIHNLRFVTVDQKEKKQGNDFQFYGVLVCVNLLPIRMFGDIIFRFNIRIVTICNFI